MKPLLAVSLGLLVAGCGPKPTVCQTGKLQPGWKQVGTIAADGSCSWVTYGPPPARPDAELYGQWMAVPWDTEEEGGDITVLTDKHGLCAVVENSPPGYKCSCTRLGAGVLCDAAP